VAQVQQVVNQLMPQPQQQQQQQLAGGAAGPLAPPPPVAPAAVAGGGGGGGGAGGGGVGGGGGGDGGGLEGALQLLEGGLAGIEAAVAHMLQGVFGALGLPHPAPPPAAAPAGAGAGAGAQGALAAAAADADVAGAVAAGMAAAAAAVAAAAAPHPHPQPPQQQQQQQQQQQGQGPPPQQQGAPLQQHQGPLAAGGGPVFLALQPAGMAPPPGGLQGMGDWGAMAAMAMGLVQPPQGGQGAGWAQPAAGGGGGAGGVAGLAGLPPLFPPGAAAAAAAAGGAWLPPSLTYLRLEYVAHVCGWLGLVAPGCHLQVLDVLSWDEGAMAAGHHMPHPPPLAPLMMDIPRTIETHAASLRGLHTLRLLTNDRRVMGRVTARVSQLTALTRLTELDLESYGLVVEEADDWRLLAGSFTALQHLRGLVPLRPPPSLGAELPGVTRLALRLSWGGLEVGQVLGSFPAAQEVSVLLLPPPAVAPPAGSEAGSEGGEEDEEGSDGEDKGGEEGADKGEGMSGGSYMELDGADPAAAAAPTTTLSRTPSLTSEANSEGSIVPRARPPAAGASGQGALPRRMPGHADITSISAADFFAMRASRAAASPRAAGSGGGQGVTGASSSSAPRPRPGGWWDSRHGLLTADAPAALAAADGEPSCAGRRHREPSFPAVTQLTLRYLPGEEGEHGADTWQGADAGAVLPAACAVLPGLRRLCCEWLAPHAAYLPDLSACPQLDALWLEYDAGWMLQEGEAGWDPSTPQGPSQDDLLGCLSAVPALRCLCLLGAEQVDPLAAAQQLAAGARVGRGGPCPLQLLRATGCKVGPWEEAAAEAAEAAAAAAQAGPGLGEEAEEEEGDQQGTPQDGNTAPNGGLAATPALSNGHVAAAAAAGAAPAAGGGGGGGGQVAGATVGLAGAATANGGPPLASPLAGPSSSHTPLPAEHNGVGLRQGSLEAAAAAGGVAGAANGAAAGGGAGPSSAAGVATAAAAGGAAGGAAGAPPGVEESPGWWRLPGGVRVVLASGADTDALLERYWLYDPIGGGPVCGACGYGVPCSHCGVEGG
jgi:hypothetical protein